MRHYTRYQGMYDCCEFFGLQRDCMDLVAGHNGLQVMCGLWEHDPAAFYENPLQLLRQEWAHTQPRYLHPGFYPSTSPGGMLDYGCGVGALTFPWARLGHGVTWVEHSEAALSYLRWKAQRYGLHNVRILSADDHAEYIGCYTGIVCVDVLEHVEDPLRLQANIWKWLKIGGHALLKLEECYPHPGHLQESCAKLHEWSAWVAKRAKLVELDTYVWVVKEKA